MATPHAKMEEEGLPKVRTWAWGRAKWRRRAAATATHGVPAESAMDGSHINAHIPPALSVLNMDGVVVVPERDGPSRFPMKFSSLFEGGG